MVYLWQNWLIAFSYQQNLKEEEKWALYEKPFCIFDEHHISQRLSLWVIWVRIIRKNGGLTVRKGHHFAEELRQKWFRAMGSIDPRAFCTNTRSRWYESRPFSLCVFLLIIGLKRKSTIFTNKNLPPWNCHFISTHTDLVLLKFIEVWTVCRIHIIFMLGILASAMKRESQFCLTDPPSVDFRLFFCSRRSQFYRKDDGTRSTFAKGENGSAN